MQVAPGDNSTFYVAQQDGVIRSFANSESVSQSEQFFDVSSLIANSSDERGLLGLAFHPNFSENGYFYVHYTDLDDDSEIARFTRGQGLASKKTILKVDQPFTNHNGGQLAFGPDGFLYIALGDGGSGGDPLNNGQDGTTLLGSIVRLDVDTPDNVLYRIPARNPFVGNSSGFREEIYAYGFRNPWRISFDPVTDRLFAGDVGQGQVEEIDLVLPGRNYGWNIMEGSRCFNPSSNCNRNGLELPIAEYFHPTGFAVIGGYVYRGSRVPGLSGAYLYGDFATGIIFSLRIGADGSVTNGQLLPTELSISAFGRDNAGEVYVVDYAGGGIYRFVGSAG
jgi:glucose/arabinose dehydrogenase